MPDPIIYHNPNCSKSRATLQLLTDRGLEPRVIHYLETPPSTDELAALLKCLGRPVTDMVRFNEPLARQLNLTATDARNPQAWLGILAAHPVLLERPIVVVGDQAAIGRPPENVLAILQA